MKDFINDFLMQMNKLSHSELRQIKSAIDQLDDKKIVSESIESLQDQRHCPHCKSKKIYKHGVSNNKQRYQCQECGKTFNSLTKTALSRLRKEEKWLKHLDCMLKSMTLRQTALELDINLKTAFRWRQRFSIGFKAHENEVRRGIVEADETYFRLSMKGKKKDLNRKAHKRSGDGSKPGLGKDKEGVLVASDRSQKGIEKICGTENIPGSSIERDKRNSKQILDYILTNPQLKET